MTHAIASRLIETHSGQLVDPFDPDPSEIHIEDIAHSLSHMCRYNGATRRFYSVAEHCVHAVRLLRHLGYSDWHQYAALMHDASEAYLPDLASPLKYGTALGTAFAIQESRLMEVIGQRYAFTWPICRAASMADEIMLWCEAHVLMPSGGASWDGYETIGHVYVAQNWSVVDWINAGLGDPAQVRKIFLSEFRRLHGGEIAVESTSAHGKGE